jgi:hypothetical protein
MSIPEQLNDEQPQQSSEHQPLRADDEVMEIDTIVLEHVAGGCPGGGGVGDN